MAKLDPQSVAWQLGAWSDGTGRLHDQLARAVTRLVEGGHLRDGDVLPPERTLAEVLSVSRGTVVRAYGTLSDEGRVERRQGSGTVVRVAEVPGPARRHRALPLFDESAATALLKAVPVNRLDLRRELAQLADGPLDPVAELPPEGLRSLRAAVATHLTARGAPTEPEQVLITNGTQHACAITLRTLCKPGDVVLTEALTWPGLTDAVTAVGARSHGIAMDDDGVRTDELRAAVQRLRPAAIVLNPHHHNPTGTRLSEERRREVADIAGDFGVPTVEDRAYADIAFDGTHAAPLVAHRPDAPIMVIDSLSKTVWDGLRIGWVRAPADFIGRLRSVRAVDDLGTAIPTQLLALQLLPRFDELLAERVAELRSKAERAHDLVRALLPSWDVQPAVGGGSLWAELPHGSARSLVAHAARSGLSLIGDETFAVDRAPDRYVRLPFTAPEDVLRESLEHLTAVWESFLERSPDRDRRPEIVV